MGHTSQLRNARMVSLGRVRKVIGRLAVCSLLVANLVAPGALRAADTPTTYSGGYGGNWNLATNWSGGVVPANAGATTFAVTVNDNNAVTFDRPGGTTVNALNLGSNSYLYLNVGDNLTIANDFTTGS